MNRKFQTFCTIAMVFCAMNTNAQLSKSQTVTGKSDYGNNIISIAPFSVNNSGLCLGVAYERFLTDDGKFSIYVPILFNHHKPQYHESDLYSETNLGTYVGFKYYTAGSHAPVRYALGALMGSDLSFRHRTYSLYNGGGVERNEHYVSPLTGFMFHNSLNVFFAQKFTYACELDLGLAGQSTYDNRNWDSTLPFVLCQMSLGYRF